MIIEKILKPIWNKFVYGGHLACLGVTALAFAVSILLNIKITWEFLVMVYLLSELTLLFNYYKEINRDVLTNPERANYHKQHLKFLPFLIFFYGIGFLILMICFGNFKNITMGIFLIFLGILFTLIFKKITKKITGFKTFYVSLCFGLLVFFTAIYYSFPLNSVVLLIFLFVFLRLSVNISFFDIKDIESDRKEGLRTFPIFFGKDNFLNYLHIVNLLSFTPIIFGVITKTLPFFSLFLLFLFFYSLYYIEKAKNKNTNIRTLSYTLVDGEYFFWPIILLLGKFLMGV